MEALRKICRRLDKYDLVHCYYDRLCLAFSRLPNLSSIAVTSAEFPFLGTDWGNLEKSWEDLLDNRLTYGYLDFQDLCSSFGTYMSVLQAVESAVLVEILDLDLIPIE